MKSMSWFVLCLLIFNSFLVVIFETVIFAFMLISTIVFFFWWIRHFVISNVICILSAAAASWRKLSSCKRAVSHQSSSWARWWVWQRRWNV
jgi:hypothetical protein